MRSVQVSLLVIALCLTGGGGLPTSAAPQQAIPDFLIDHDARLDAANTQGVEAVPARRI